MQIDGPERLRLREGIIKAFSYQEFKTFLNDRHDLNLDVIGAVHGNYEEQLRDAIIWFNNRGRIEFLVATIIAERPDIPEIRELAYEWGFFPIAYGGDDTKEQLAGNALETVLANGGPLININTFVTGIIDAKRCICRIELEDSEGSKRYGTGFLVGDDLLLTNYHVMEPAIDDNSLAESVICKFDYEIDAKGKTINPGTDISLANGNPILASSPPGYYDIHGSETIKVDWKADELDYALVRLSKKIGSKPYGLKGEKTSSDKAVKRGWIKRSQAPPALSKGSNIIILQHPDREPIKMAIGMNRIEGCDANKRRVRYKLTTMAGSSGSPCFDHDLNWIALHNSGDPAYNPKYNQGIPANRILEDLKNKYGINL